MNLSSVLNAVRNHEPVSRTRVAQITSLNKATVTNLVRSLHQGGFLRELDVISENQAGRPAIGLGLNPGAGTIIGAEIGVDFISVIVTNFSPLVLWRQRRDTRNMQPDDILNAVIRLLHRAHGYALTVSPTVFGLGLGVPGLVDLSRGLLLFAPNLHWRDVSLRHLLEEHFPVPIYVDNEANMAALGEAYFGAAAGYEHVLYISSGVGLGGGFVLNGRLMTGATGFAGEIGHMTLVPSGGLLCNCGNHGCWETVASQEAVFRHIKGAAQIGGRTLLLESAGGDLDRLTIPMVVQAAEQGDRMAKEALEETGNWLGIGIASLINAFNPQRAVFGGIMSLAQEFLIPAIHQAVRERAWTWSAEACEIVVAAHGADAGVMGAVASVHKDVMIHPDSWS